jgi:streptogramin lyase
VAGVSHDGQRVWIAGGAQLIAFDPRAARWSARCRAPATRHGVRRQAPLADRRDAHRQDRSGTGDVVASIPAPGSGSDSGLAWAEGSLWVGQYRDRKIHRIDPTTGAVLRTIESNRFVTGVTWVDGELWHGTWEGDDSEIRRIDPESGAVLDRLAMPAGTVVSGSSPTAAISSTRAAAAAARSARCAVPSRPLVIDRSTSLPGAASS